MSFKIWTHTANEDGAKTDADVTIQLIGDRASDEYPLDGPGDDRRQNATNDFTIGVPEDLGNIREFRLFLEGGTRFGPASWAVDMVTAKCLETGRMWEWRSNESQWLHAIVNKSAPLILRAIEVTGQAEPVSTGR